MPTLSFAPGFPAADFIDCAPSVFAYGRTQADADAAADAIAAAVVEPRERFRRPNLSSADEGVRHAMELATSAERPIVIADTQDNPGAGGDSDTTGMLRALVRNNATRAAIGVVFDPQSAAAAHAAGVGATVTLALGGKSGIPGDEPYQASFVVETLSDGKFVGTGPFYRGRSMNMGPSAALRIDGVQVVVASRKAQLADQAMYRYVGIEPTAQAILVNKSSVHFRADFEPIAEKLLICAAPGAMPADPATLPWKRLRPGIRIGADGPDLRPRPITNTCCNRITTMPNIERMKALPTNYTTIHRDLHAHPEIELRGSPHHPRHSRRKADAMGVEVHRGLGGTSVVGVLKGQDQAPSASTACRHRSRCRWKRTPDTALGAPPFPPLPRFRP